MNQRREAIRRHGQIAATRRVRPVSQQTTKFHQEIAAANPTLADRAQRAINIMAPENVSTSAMPTVDIVILSASPCLRHIRATTFMNTSRKRHWKQAGFHHWDRTVPIGNPLWQVPHATLAGKAYDRS